MLFPDGLINGKNGNDYRVQQRLHHIFCMKKMIPI
jgi:hypothetical protein